MNPFVADPEWGWWIVFYFFLGGIAAGTYFLATLIELLGKEEDRPLARIGYRLAFPLICVCGILLIVDLENPARFWHMMFQSEVVHAALNEGWPLGGWGTMVYAPLLKWWSPMSIGAWALGLFGAWSSLSFLATFWNPRPLAYLLGPTWLGHSFHLIGCGIGFFVASYTGVLLNATNQPLWSMSEWIAPLFLASAASTAIAVLLLVGKGMARETRERLEKADLWVLGLELFLFLIFLASLGSLLPLLLATWQGWVLVFGTLLAGLLIPLSLHLGFKRADTTRVTTAAWSALIGGFMLRFGIVNIAPALLHLLADQPRLSERMDALQAPLYASWIGVAFILLTLVLAGAIPFLLRKQWKLSPGRSTLAYSVSCLVLACVGYYSMQAHSEQTAIQRITRFRISPEDDREIGGGHGASLFNRPTVVHMRSKITKGETP